MTSPTLSGGTDHGERLVYSSAGRQEMFPPSQSPSFRAWEQRLPRRRPGLRRHFAILWILLSVSACRSGGGGDDAATRVAAIQRGDVLAERKQYAEAAAAYRTAVDGNPRDGETRLKLARAYMQLGDWQKADPEAIRAADLLPANRDAQHLAITMMLGHGRFQDALDRVETALKSQRDDAALLVLYGNAKARLPFSTTALSALEEVMRLGRYVPEVQAYLRPTSLRADDRLAEDAFRRAVQLNPDSAEPRLALANFYWAVGRLEEAEEPLRWVADRDPTYVMGNRALGLFYASRGREDDAEKYLEIAAATNDRDSQFALADYYVQRNRDEEALALLDKLAAGDDPDGGAASRAADIEFRLGRREQAMQRTERILARDPLNARALRIKAQATFAAGDIVQATTLARSAVAADPGSAEARAVLARSLLASGDRQGAFNEFSEAWRRNPADAEIAKELTTLALTLGRDEVALEFARERARLRPKDREASMTLVRVFTRTGDLAGAERALAPLLVERPTRPDVLVLLGAIQAARGSTDAARSTYRAALQADRNSLDALSGLVALAIDNNQVDQVTQLVEQGVSAHPKHPGYLLLAARTARASGDARRAESMLRAILNIDPRHAEAELLLIDNLHRQNRREEVKQLVQRALTRPPSSFELEVKLATLLEATGHLAEARPRYEAIVTANPKSGAVAARLAALYANQRENLERALELAQMAKQQLPDDPSVSDTLGWVYVLNGLPSVGEPHLRDAVRAAPATALYRYHLGIAYQQQSQFRGARTELTQALTLDPNFPAAADARAALKALAR
jgi:tetratricopeptide (TPR) repeat protein